MELAAIGALAFLAIEGLEGNLALGGSLRSVVALVALVPIAMLVRWLAPRAGTALCEIGISLRASLQTRGRETSALVSTRASMRVVATSQTVFTRDRGRAPPLHA